jgi:hypothetical protein
MFFKGRVEIGVDGYHRREQGYHMSNRRRQNLIAFRTTEGTALEARHQQALANGESMKAIVESWAETFSPMTKASEQEGTND